MSHQWWGSQSHQVGFYEYGVSPFHLKLFKGFINPGFPKFVKRTSSHLMYIAPPMLFYYFLSEWALKKYEYYTRKEYLMSEEHLKSAHH